MSQGEFNLKQIIVSRNKFVIWHRILLLKLNTMLKMHKTLGMHKVAL